MMSRWESQGLHAAEVISVRFSQGRRENRSTTVELSPDHHKLLCLHLTLTATLLYEGQQAETMLSTTSVVTAGWGGKEKLTRYDSHLCTMMTGKADCSIATVFSSFLSHRMTRWLL